MAPPRPRPGVGRDRRRWSAMRRGFRLLRQRSCACWTFAMALKASVRRLLRTESMNDGSATAASIAMTATVIMISINVKPRAVSVRAVRSGERLLLRWLHSSDGHCLSRQEPLVGCWHAAHQLAPAVDGGQQRGRPCIPTPAGGAGAHPAQDVDHLVHGRAARPRSAPCRSACSCPWRGSKTIERTLALQLHRPLLRSAPMRMRLGPVGAARGAGRPAHRSRSAAPVWTM